MDNRTYNTEKMYLEYVNDFITVERFADHHGLTNEHANLLIDLGRKVNNSLNNVATVRSLTISGEFYLNDK